MKKRVIVYGLGEDYKKTKVIIEDKFEVIGRCDSMIMDGGVCGQKIYPVRNLIISVLQAANIFRK